jgi:site-specific DNA-methyltransferase (adenine-specific)
LINSAKDIFRYEIIWEKERPSNFAFAKHGIMKYHENILIFGEGKGTYNPQMTKGKPNHSVGKGIRKKNNESGANTAIVTNKTDGLKHPKSVLKFNREAKPEHPTQKPVALLEYLIKTYTLEGETVLDNCAGSGSTGVACINTNRNFIGIEKDDKYFEIAKKRIEEAQRVLF